MKKKIHEAQKPENLIEFLIRLTTTENQIILDPFYGKWYNSSVGKKFK